MAIVEIGPVSWREQVCSFTHDYVIPVLIGVFLFMATCCAGALLYIAISHIDTPIDKNFSYTTWDGHEYVTMHREGGWGVTHSPRCKCLPNIEKILHDARKPGIWMYMDVPVTNLPQMYNDGQYNIMLCGAKE